MAIHSETFTNLTEFVKNHLVKINKISVSLSKTVSLISQRSKDFCYVNRIAKHVSDKAQLKTNIITANKTITKSS